MNVQVNLVRWGRNAVLPVKVCCITTMDEARIAVEAGVLGLESGVVRLVPYHATWPSLFEAERDRLSEAFAAADLSASIEHMGSTAIPGLAAKPIIDILVGYPENANVPPYIRALTDAGYVHRGEQGIAGREFFRRGDPRAYHIHLAVAGGSFWRDHLTFRDRLLADDSLRDAYAALKHDLASRFPRDRESYIEGKTSFVRAVLEARPGE